MKCAKTPKKARNWLVVSMLSHTKSGNHGSLRKHEQKTKARGKIDMRKEGY